MNNILLLDDYEECRLILTTVLRRVFTDASIWPAETLQQAHQLIDQRPYELAIIDLNLPDGCGTELLHTLHRRQPKTLCVVASISDDDDSLFDSLKAGAQGYLLKDDPPDILAQHLAGIGQHQPPLSARMANRMIGYFNRLQAQPQAIDFHLTAREREVLKLITEGASRKAIARHLDISIYTANDHVKAIYRKLKVSSSAEATRLALKQGLSS